MSLADLLKTRALTPLTPGNSAGVNNKPATNQSFDQVDPIDPGKCRGRDETLKLDASEPTKLCRCGGGYFRMIGGLWWCSQCDPFEDTPEATLTIPGGELRRSRTDVDATIHAAVDGLPITADQFRDWLDPEDLKDIGRGLIPTATVRAYAQEAVRQGPRELGTTAGGVRVQTYKPAPSEPPPKPAPAPEPVQPAAAKPAQPVAEPTAPCSTCGGGSCHQATVGGEWRCTYCRPSLAMPVDVRELHQDALEHFTERAAIAEFDGELSRTEAERQAASLVFEYRLTDWDQYAVLLVHSGGIDAARAWCAERFGAERVVDVRKYEPDKN